MLSVEDEPASIVALFIECCLVGLLEVFADGAELGICLFESLSSGLG